MSHHQQEKFTGKSRLPIPSCRPPVVPYHPPHLLVSAYHLSASCIHRARRPTPTPPTPRPLPRSCDAHPHSLVLFPLCSSMLTTIPNVLQTILCLKVTQWRLLIPIP